MHLAAHVAGDRISTVVVGKNGDVTIRPLDLAWARQQFNTLLESYLRGLCFPLPLAAQTGFAWLGKSGTRFQGVLQSCNHQAVSPARNVFEPSFSREGEAQHSPYLQRVYPTFNDLWSNGEFTAWCDTLYAPLRDSVGVKSDSK
jgi:exodeoxyribonuclease V gamma subunit